jgi:hypothetical protein
MPGKRRAGMEKEGTLPEEGKGNREEDDGENYLNEISFH